MSRSNKVSLSRDIDQKLNDILISSKSEFDANFPKYLLWEQQRKQCQLKSKKSMRQYPLMIRWCLRIYVKSPCQQLVRFVCFVTIYQYSSLLGCSFGLDKFIYINEYLIYVWTVLYISVFSGQATFSCISDIQVKLACNRKYSSQGTLQFNLVTTAKVLFC